MPRPALWFRLLPLFALACAGVSERRETRWRDPDEDEVPWPEDCDSQDPAVGTNEWYADLDGDGWGDATTYTQACLAPGDAYIERAGDCDDADAQRHPNRTEACDGLDNDCDGLIDNNPATDEPTESGFFDGDGDGYGGGDEETFCALPEGWAPLSGDCDDAAPDVNPGAAVVCDDGIDNNCDGLSDCARYLKGEIDGAGDVRFVGDNRSLLNGDALMVDLTGEGELDLVLGSKEVSLGTHGGVFVLPGPLPASGSLNVLDSAWPLQGDVNLSGEMGTALRAADLDIDGVVDLIITAPAGADDPGRVYVVFGPLTGPLDMVSGSAKEYALLLGDRPGDGFGDGVLIAELDGDGQADLLVSATSTIYLSAKTTYGSLHLFEGPIRNDKDASSADHVVFFNSQSALTGAKLSSLGDVTGDGLDEVMLALRGWKVTEGSTKVTRDAVLMLEGDLTDSVDVEDLVGWRVQVDGDDGDFGATLLNAGDLDLDGYGDVVIGAPLRDKRVEDDGTAWVFSGVEIAHVNPTSTDPNTLSVAEVTGDAFDDQRVGAALAAPGDVDRDGKADLLVGAPGLPDYGGAFLLYGPIEGHIQAKDLDTTITALKVLGAEYGEGLAAPGDVNGLGHPDLLLYAPENTTWHLLFTDAL
ncbi:MAG: FG-GAP repeat protein [Deltaproteobacteria bacterium]|nr:FG-GAP repeat protein [Deltaproteobacteria bacterium]MBK9649335.1 FG-GAP repeat protein [Deltaproteobacteria bacterium]